MSSTNSRRYLRRIAKWALVLLVSLLVLVGIYVGMLVYPEPLFAHSASFGTYRVFADETIPDDFDRVIEDLDRRLRAMEHGPPAADQRIYLCGPRRFSFFAFLLRMNPDSLAIGLSRANSSFVSVERVASFAAQNRGRLRHTRFEGSIAEVVAHEIAHFNSLRALGMSAHLGQPLWKSEGWAEYQANLAPMHDDPDYDLVRRIELLGDDEYWGRRYGMARSFWEYQLLVEFLGEVRGYRLVDLVKDDVTESHARSEMLLWYRRQIESRQG